jgi:neutral ceramidase
MSVLLPGWRGTLPAQDQAKPAERVFRAGAATSNITPPLGEPIVGGFDPAPSKHIHDELHARCLVLDDGKNRIGIVLCDNVGIPREVYDAAKVQLAELVNIPRQHLLMAATHTHSATSARSDQRLAAAAKLSDYQQYLVRRIVEGVRRAVHNLEPAKIAWGSASEPSEVFNRRWHMLPGPELKNPFGGTDQVRMNPPRGSASLVKPAGPVDPEISFISVQSKEGRPIALLANYSLHYVGGTGPSEISADYFAMFADRVQQLLGADRLDPPFVGILSNGTSGDVNNINFREKGERKKPYEKMREVADKVARAVYAEHQKLTFQNWVSLAGAERDLVLAARKPTPELLEWARTTLAKPEREKLEHSRERHYARRTLLQNEAPSDVAVPLQTLRIGDLGIAAIPFEVFTEIGLEIKEKGPFAKTFTIELANGSYGYLPSPPQHKLGGYETWLGTNLVEVDASTKIVATLMELFASLKQ